MVMLISTFITLFFVSFSANSEFKQEEIIFPVGQKQVKEFLSLLEKPVNSKIAKLLRGDIRYKDIPSEGSTVFTIGRQSYMLYWADLNNDGSDEYTLIYIQSGTGGYSGVLGSYNNDTGKLISLKFDDVVVNNLFPGKDMSRFYGVLGRPFAVKINGKSHLRFVERGKKPKVHTFLWEKEKFTEVEL